MTRVLVLQTAWLGDVVLTTPLLQALAERDGPVDVLVTPDAAPLLRTHPAVRDILTYDKRGTERGVLGLARQARRLRARGYTRAVLAQGSFRSGVLARLAGIPHRIGFADAPGARWCTERRPRPTAHEAERLLALAEVPAPTSLALHLTAADHAAAATALGDAGVPDTFVALAPGSARATKRWPFYRELAAALAPDVGVVILGTPRDGAAVLGQTGGRDGMPAGGHLPANLSGLPIRVAAAILARAAVAVVNDSAPLHLAQAVGTPVVALFGPTHPSLGFGPRGPRDVVLGIELACRPCSTHGGRRCPLGHHRCLRELAVATVLDAVHHALAHREVSCG